jgi:hypothetical protein
LVPGELSASSALADTTLSAVVVTAEAVPFSGDALQHAFTALRRATNIPFHIAKLARILL